MRGAVSTFRATPTACGGGRGRTAVFRMTAMMEGTHTHDRGNNTHVMEGTAHMMEGTAHMMEGTAHMMEGNGILPCQYVHM